MHQVERLLCQKTGLTDVTISRRIKHGDPRAQCPKLSTGTLRSKHPCSSVNRLRCLEECLFVFDKNELQKKKKKEAR